MKFLNLQHNGITIIETGAFDNLPELQVLELDFNEIRELDPHWFTGNILLLFYYSLNKQNKHRKCQKDLKVFNYHPKLVSHYHIKTRKEIIHEF